MLKNNNKGYTLIEQLIYLALVAAIAIIFTSFTADVVRTSVKALAIKEVNQSARILMAQISQEIKTAKQINSISSSQLSLTNYNNTTVVFEYDSANYLVTFNNGSGAVPISNDSVRVTSFSFNELTNGVIEINLGLSQKNPNLPEVQKYHLEVSSVVALRSPLY